MQTEYSKSVADWDPGNGKTMPGSDNAKLLSTEAHDVPENISGNNQLKEHFAAGKPQGPFGPRGHEF